MRIFKKSLIAVLAASAVAALCVPTFSGCATDLGYILKSDENGEYYSVRATGYTSFMSGEVVIPDYYEGIPVKEIEANGFASTSMTKLVIPATIEKIGNAAFSYNRDLTEVEFAEGSALKAIPWGGFAECPNLTQITIPSSVTSIGGMAFYDCSRLDTVELSDSLETIGIAAFYGCTSLEEVELPEGLVSIAGMAFYNCTSLESIILPNGMHDTKEPELDEDGNQVLDDKGKPVYNTIPAVGQIAFFNCTSLKLAVLGEGITSVEEGTFSNCFELETLYLPQSLTEVKGNCVTSSAVYGHAFYGTPLANVYYAGTEEQWAEVVIDASYYASGSEVSNNSSLINAEVICGTSYTK